LQVGQRTIVAAVCALFSQAIASAAQGRPATDIFVAPLSIHDGRPVIGKPVNITDRAGNDFAPVFTPDGRAILCISRDDAGQSDIYRYDMDSKAIVRVTATPENESSPSIMPGGARFSVIRADHPRKAEGALVHVDMRTAKIDTLGRGVGRSLTPLLDHGGFSFTHPADSTIILATMRWPEGQSRDLVAPPRSHVRVRPGRRTSSMLSRTLPPASKSRSPSTWRRPACCAMGANWRIPSLAGRCSDPPSP
jgi:hypothetical protein